MTILGISAFYHDSAAALVRDGEIVAAAQEERFSRRKHDAAFPATAIRYCLAEGGVTDGHLDAVAFYDKPVSKFARILQTYFAVAPRGVRSFLMAMPLWLRQKLWTSLVIEKSLAACGIRGQVQLLFPEHHESHAASAFFPSPFRRAAVLTLDGVGEWATSTLGHGEDNRVTITRELRFPHSLGLLYSAFTYFTGFRVNSGEYKLMGLAPYGQPRYVDRIREHLLDLKNDGSFRLNMGYFGYLDGLSMTNERFADLFDGPPRNPEAEITRREMDLARSIQAVTEEIVLRMARHLHRETAERYLCLAGGVALNCVANGRLLREGPFADLWIQPAAGDAGGALGAALVAWHHYHGRERHADGTTDRMRGAYLGPAFEDAEIEAFLRSRGCPARKLAPDARADEIARLLEEGKVVGHFHGRMEFGPRALGNRSILGDARSPEMQSVMNRKIKYRESFRPFAPSCLEECAAEFFELDRPSPYMLLTAPVHRDRCRTVDRLSELPLRERVHAVRSDVPAVTHVDFSARVQTVNRKTNPAFHDVIQAFQRRTGYGIVINTSLNVRGEPIACTPEDAYRCFRRTGMDCLVLGSFLLSKEEQPAWQEQTGWQEEFPLD
ncbi:MAG: carbamoyltransferase [Lentisphaeria bacterium]|nr:carbamoyltransferase [Lentisphaeria bacterium]